MKTLFILFVIFAVKVYADCWSKQYGYPCCSENNKNVIYSDEVGEWGNENGNWCGIVKDEPIANAESVANAEPITTTKIIKTTKTIPTSRRNCPKFTFPYDMCTRKGGKPSAITRNGCPTPTCVVENCWAKKLGYPCCSYTNSGVIYKDNDGEWGMENNEWCGILSTVTATTTTTTTTNTKTIPSTKGIKNCPRFTFAPELCTKRGGKASQVTRNGCPTPTCVIENCWSEKLGYPCCSYMNGKVIYKDINGEWGNENGEWCGIVNSIPQTAAPPTTTTTTTNTKTIPSASKGIKICPKFTFAPELCTKRGGKASQVTRNGCPTPTCVIENTSETTATPTTTTASTKTIPSTSKRINCPKFTFPYDMCTRKGGKPSAITRNGCPTPTCVIENCWSEKLGYPCCSYTNSQVVFKDFDGGWGLENGEWCGIINDAPTN